MIKMIAIYQTPEDAEAFLTHYRDVHVPLVKKVPGLLRAEVTKINRTMIGDNAPFLIAEMYFADKESFSAAMKSPENAAAGQDLMTFAKGRVTLVQGEILDV